MNRWAGAACALCVVLLFAGFTLVSRLGFASAWSLPDLAAIRFGVGGLLLLPVFVRHRLARLRWRQALTLAWLGGLGFGLLAYTGFWLAPASHGAVLLHGTLPLFSFGVAWLLTRRGIAGRTKAGLALLAAGMATMAYDSLSSATPAQLLGDAALLLASLSWSTYGLLAQKWDVRPAPAAAMVAVLSMLVYVPGWLVYAGPADVPPVTGAIVLQVLFQGVLLGAVSIFVYTQAVSLLGATQIALWTAAVPCVTALLAIPMLGEIPTPLAWGGVALATAGLLAAVAAPARPASLQANPQ